VFAKCEIVRDRVFFVGPIRRRSRLVQTEKTQLKPEKTKLKPNSGSRDRRPNRPTEKNSVADDFAFSKHPVSGPTTDRPARVICRVPFVALSILARFRVAPGPAAEKTKHERGCDPEESNIDARKAGGAVA
jgi:hypothetical protein